MKNYRYNISGQEEYQLIKASLVYMKEGVIGLQLNDKVVLTVDRSGCIDTNNDMIKDGHDNAGIVYMEAL